MFYNKYHYIYNVYYKIIFYNDDKVNDSYTVEVGDAVIHEVYHSRFTWKFYFHTAQNFKA